MSTFGLDGWLVGRTSADLRECYLAWRFRPLARIALRTFPWLESVTVAFSQWWCDEADDAVHEDWALSPERDPPWLVDPTAFRSTDGWPRERPSLIDLARRHGLPADCDDNASLIVAFASCCTESPTDCWHHPPPTPWAVARREGGSTEPSLEVVGRVWRPEWEDRWDVGFQRTAMRTLALDATLAVVPSKRALLRAAEPSPTDLLRRVLRFSDALDLRENEPTGRARAAQDLLDGILKQAARLREEIELR